MGREDPRFLVVGHMNKPHGTKGELFVWPLTDHPEGTFAPGVVLRPGRAEGNDPDPDLPPLHVVGVRPFRRGYLVSFRGVDDRFQAALLSGCYLYREMEELEPLAEGELFYHQVLGLDVVTTEGRAVGKVTEIYELRPADLLEVSDGERQVLIPLVEGVVVDVDLDDARLVIDPPDGLLDL
jgi:16S rRNA processing protein RimM